MERHFELIPEDAAIQELVKMLGFNKPNTAQGIGDTLNKIESHFKGRFAVGLVDDDKTKPKLFDLYDCKEDESENLRLLKKSSGQHFLIVIEPAIEVWLFEQAAKAGITPPFASRKELEKITKNNIAVIKNKDFNQFLHQLKQAQSPGFIVLEKWLTDLFEKYRF